MKTRKLKYIPDYDFELLGLLTSENDYKLSWSISKVLNIEFRKCNDLEISDRKTGDKQVFSIFENCDKIEKWKLKLVSNKGNIGYLIPELKNIDYFLIIRYENEYIPQDDLISKLKNTNGISGVFKIESQNLKSKERLFF